MTREYRLLIDTDGSIEIVDPNTLESTFADKDSNVSEEVVSMLDEAKMI
jgi:hypothetical protein